MIVGLVVSVGSVGGGHQWWLVVVLWMELME